MRRLFAAELVFACTAQRTDPVLRNILPFGAGGDAYIRTVHIRIALGFLLVQRPAPLGLMVPVYACIRRASVMLSHNTGGVRLPRPPRGYACGPALQ